MPGPHSGCSGAGHSETLLPLWGLTLNLTIHVKEKTERSESKPSQWIFPYWEPLHYLNCKHAESPGAGLKGVDFNWRSKDA